MSERPRRIDREGRDVTHTPGLWDESDLYECDCGFAWHQKHGEEEDCANCECERLGEDVQRLCSALRIIVDQDDVDEARVIASKALHGSIADGRVR